MPQFNILHEMYILVNQIVENVFVPINLNFIYICLYIYADRTHKFSWYKSHSIERVIILV